MSDKKIVFLCGNGDTLIRFRLELIKSLIKKSYEIYAYAPEIRDEFLEELHDRVAEATAARDVALEHASGYQLRAQEIARQLTFTVQQLTAANAKLEEAQQSSSGDPALYNFLRKGLWPTSVTTRVTLRYLVARPRSNPAATPT